MGGLTVSHPYVASMTGVSANLTLTGFAGLTCSIDNTGRTGTLPQDCTAVASATTHDVAVGGFTGTGSGQGGRYAMLITPQTPTTPHDEGSGTTPIDLSLATPHPYGVGQDGGISYYRIQGLSVAALISLTDLNDGTAIGTTESAYLSVFTDAGFSNALTCLNAGVTFAGPTPEDCTVDAGTVAGASGTLYLEVTNPVATSVDTGYVLTVSPAP